MKTLIVALAAATALAGVARAQTPNDPNAAAKEAQYQDQKAQYEDRKAEYQDQKEQYRAEKHAYHRELENWAAGQTWPERFRGDRYVITDYSVKHLHNPGEGYHWFRTDDGRYVRVGPDNLIAEVVTPQ